MTNESTASPRLATRRPPTRDLLLLAPIGATVAGILFKELTAPPPMEIPGRKLRVDDRSLHVLSRVSSGPTIVLESGIGMPLTTWSWIFDQFAARGTSVLAYERPGVGFSSGARPPAPERYPEQLMSVLRIAGAPPPYILVGHAVGGLLIRMFAARYPELVAGMVFVDAAHPDQYERSIAKRNGLTESNHVLRRLIAERTVGRPAGFASAHLRPGPDLVQLTNSAALRPSTRRGARREVALSRTRWAAGARQLSGVTCPVAVVSAGSTLSGAPLFVNLHQELAELSDVHRSETVAGADHVTVLTNKEHAERVVDAIAWVRSSMDDGTAAALRDGEE